MVLGVNNYEIFDFEAQKVIFPPSRPVLEATKMTWRNLDFRDFSIIFDYNVNIRRVRGL